MKTSEQIKVGATSVQSKQNPEWGTFGVREDHGAYYTIQGDRGQTTLSKSEADRLWEVA